MITINANDHEVMNRMHVPGDEKRMPVILLPEDYDRWLNADPELARVMCQQFPAALMQADAAPAPPRKKKAAAQPEPSDPVLPLDASSSA